jgi:C-terminal processing protease CtpA/Prc
VPALTATWIIAAPFLSMEYGKLLMFDDKGSIDKTEVVERARRFDQDAMSEVERWVAHPTLAPVALSVLTPELAPVLERHASALAASKEPGVKRALLDAAFKLDLANVVPLAESLSLDPDADVRRAAHECLCKNDDALACLQLDADNERVCTASKKLNPIGVALDREAETPVIAYVCIDGPAHRAGLQEGDEITHVDGQATSTPSRLNAALMFTKSHTKIRLNVRRETGDAMMVELQNSWR